MSFIEGDVNALKSAKVVSLRGKYKTFDQILNRMLKKYSEIRIPISEQHKPKILTWSKYVKTYNTSDMSNAHLVGLDKVEEFHRLVMKIQELRECPTQRLYNWIKNADTGETKQTIAMSICATLLTKDPRQWTTESLMGLKGCGKKKVPFLLEIFKTLSNEKYAWIRKANPCESCKPITDCSGYSDEGRTDTDNETLCSDPDVDEELDDMLSEYVDGVCTIDQKNTKNFDTYLRKCKLLSKKTIGPLYMAHIESQKTIFFAVYETFVDKTISPQHKDRLTEIAGILANNMLTVKTGKSCVILYGTNNLAVLPKYVEKADNVFKSQREQLKKNNVTLLMKAING